MNKYFYTQNYCHVLQSRKTSLLWTRKGVARNTPTDTDTQLISLRSKRLSPQQSSHSWKYRRSLKREYHNPLRALEWFSSPTEANIHQRVRILD